LFVIFFIPEIQSVVVFLWFFFRKNLENCYFDCYICIHFQRRVDL